MDSSSNQFVAHMISRYPVPDANEQLQAIIFLQQFFILRENTPKQQIDYSPPQDEAEESEIRKALDILVTGNVRMVRDIIRKAKDKGHLYMRTGTYSEEDLLQEGLLGIYRAIPRFDPKRGNVFSTYAYWWIRQSIHKLIQSQCREVRIPASIQERYRKIKKIKALHQNTVSIQLIAELMSVKATIVESTIFDCEVWNSTVSLDTHKLSKNKSSVSPTLADDTSVDHPYANPDVQLADGFRRDAVSQAIAALDVPERIILINAFGLLEADAVTLKQIWQDQSLYFPESYLPLTYDKVLRLKESAFQKIKECFPGLSDYIES